MTDKLFRNVGNRQEKRNFYCCTVHFDSLNPLLFQLMHNIRSIYIKRSNFFTGAIVIYFDVNIFNVLIYIYIYNTLVRTIGDSGRKAQFLPTSRWEPEISLGRTSWTVYRPIGRPTL
jgi:midasin (ATPase involved in ribosome maturation)